MGSNAKKKTTMAKLNREQRLRDKRMEKQAKKEARRLAAAEPVRVAVVEADDPSPSAGTTTL